MATENQLVQRDDNSASEGPIDHDRRDLLVALTAVAGVSAVGFSSTSVQAQADSAPVPRRALTGRDASGKSVFKSFDVTPQVVTFESRPGLAFYELYSTDGVPRVTGQEPDPMLTKKGSFPAPGGTLFRLVMFPPKPPQGSRADPKAYENYLHGVGAEDSWNARSTLNVTYRECIRLIASTMA